MIGPPPDPPAALAAEEAEDADLIFAVEHAVEGTLEPHRIAPIGKQLFTLRNNVVRDRMARQEVSNNADVEKFCDELSGRVRGSLGLEIHELKAGDSTCPHQRSAETVVLADRFGDVPDAGQALGETHPLTPAERPSL